MTSTMESPKSSEGPTSVGAVAVKVTEPFTRALGEEAEREIEASCTAPALV